MSVWRCLKCQAVCLAVVACLLVGMSTSLGAHKYGCHELWVSHRKGNG